MRLFLVVATLLGLFSAAAQAADRIALVIANSTYAGAPVLADAASAADVVTASLQRAGYQVRLVNEADRNGMAGALVDLSQALGASHGAIGLLYYVGYAAQAGGSNFLLPVDAAISGPDDIASKGVPLNGILDLLGGTGGIIVLDAAWNDALANSGIERGLAPVEPLSGTIIALSARPGTTPPAGGAPRSVYAQAFAAALDEPGLDVQLVLRKIRDGVLQASGGSQEPWALSSLSSAPFVLNQGAAPLEPAPPEAAMPPPPPPAASGDDIAGLPLPNLPEPPAYPLDPSIGGGGGGYSEPSWPDGMESFHGPDYGSGGYYADSGAGSATDRAAEEAESQRYEEEQARYEAERQRYEEALRAAREHQADAAGGAEQAQASNNLGGMYEVEQPLPPVAVPEKAIVSPESQAAEAAEMQRYQEEMARRSEEEERQRLEARRAALERGVAEIGILGIFTGPRGDNDALDDPGGPFGGVEPSPATKAPDAPRRPIVPGGGDGMSAGGGEEIAPGGGGNAYVDVMTMAEPDAWAAVSGSTDPVMVSMYLVGFPSGPHHADAARLYAELTGAPAAAGEPAAETAMPHPVPAPSAPAETTLARHPALDAPEEVVAGEVFTVSVALTEENLTPDVTARAAPTTSLTAEGALEFSLPAATEEWPIDIDLLAAGFDLADGGKWSRRVVLYKVGDSDFARFELKARKIADVSKPRQLMARFYHEGRFLGSASRPVTVLREAAPPAEAASPPVAMLRLVATPPAVLASDVLIGDDVDVPDLDVTIHYDDPDNLGAGLIILHSPHMAGPVSAEFTTPAGMSGWLNSEYMRLVQLGLQTRGAQSLTQPSSADPQAQKAFIAKVAEGFGDDLYRNYVPQAFKDVFWSLKLRGLVHSIQITSNSPVLPWELVRPQAAEGAQSDGFLGISYRLARWAPRTAASQVDQPLNRLPFTGVATVAPSYANNQELPFQQTEIDALSKLDGFRMIGGDFSSFEKMLGETSTGFIHFSGHGAVNDPGTGAPVFAIQLADQLLDPTTWQALTFAPRDKGNPFYFFNACDTGRAASLGGFVQGWGPAVLASGASGFIGGMWALTDRTAASFSTEFYGGLTDHLADGPVYLAEVLQGVRKRFYETGDPTYLAYTFYGNANLKVVQ